MKKSKPTIPSPKRMTARLKFFQDHQNDYAPEKVKSEVQRFAYTEHGQKVIKKMIEEQAIPKSISDLKERG